MVTDQWWVMFVRKGVGRAEPRKNNMFMFCKEEDHLVA
jgi:hypothetical protein